jgi:ribonuclease Z
MRLTVLGSGSALPAPDRNPPAFLLQTASNDYLIDCGEGAQLQLRNLKIPLGRLRAIFITHLHGDHFLGLFGLLWTLQLMSRKKELHIIAPENLRHLIDTMVSRQDGELPFAIVFTSLEGGHAQDHIYEDRQIQVRTFPLSHGIPCFGYVFTEPPKMRRLIKERIEELGLRGPMLKTLKEGKDIIDENGHVILSANITEPAPPPLKYVHCTDTLPMELPQMAHDADLLYHEATFMHDLADRAEATNHSTTVQAAQIAEATRSKRLMIGHFSSRYQDIVMLEHEARSVFPETFAARDGLVVEIG